jgi:hypothetical protein
MSFIRLLALSYLAWAAVFVVTVILVAHLPLPGDLAAGNNTAFQTGRNAMRPPPDKTQSRAVARLDLAPLASGPGPVARLDLPPLAPLAGPPEALAPSPENTQQTASGFHIPDPPPLDAPIFSRSQFVAARLGAGLTPEMVRNFDLFVYISKADRGPFSQRMYVFEKQGSGDLNPLFDWPVSTGREQREVNARGERAVSTTPAGYYELDPDRMYPKYHSNDWNEDMPDAMFFSWEQEGVRTGLAIHAATGRDIDRLGSRASPGSVRLAPENAAILFDLIRGRYRGQVPRFAFDLDSQTMSNRGRFMHHPAGGLSMADGYRVLIRVENYGGSYGIGAALF